MTDHQPKESKEARSVPKTSSMGTYHILTEDEKEKIPNLFKRYDGNLKLITQDLFEDLKEKGTSKRGRAVRAFLVEKGLKYEPVVRGKKTKLSEDRSELTPEEKSFVSHHYGMDMSKEELASMLWPVMASTGRVFFETNLYVALSEFVNKEFPPSSFLDEGIMEKTGRYTPPRTMGQVIKKVEKVAIIKFDQHKLSTIHKRNLEKLLEFLNAPRFVQIMNTYQTVNDRALFESEYIRTTWEKTDLDSDGLNLYMNVCMEYVNLMEIEMQKQKLNRMFADAEEQSDLTIKFTEMLKTKSDEYNQCSKRIDSMLTKLNGDRAKKMASQKDRNASFLTLVSTWQEEEERQRMIKMAEMQQQAIYAEADRLESMSEWKARILGIAKHEAI